MKFVSWNVNGLRACVTKGFLDVFKEMDADFFCLQETKLQEGQISLDLPGYHQFWCSAQKKGYSGTAIFTRHQPMSVSYGLGIEELDTEGRLITLEYPEFFLVTCYTPNAQRGLARIDHRMRWEQAFRAYLKSLDSRKPVILCGDLNVAHQEIDLKNPGSNRGNAGFSDQERDAFAKLLDSGFTDTFRHLYPNKTGAYSWWSYMFNARQNNAGWRIDYFVVSNRLGDAIHDATIHPDVMGSDHCPVGLDLNITCNGGIRIPTPDFTNTENEQEAGGDPTGPAHIWKPIAITALALAVLVTAVWFLFPEQDPSPSRVSQTVTLPTLTESNLIASMIDYTDYVRYTVSDYFSQDGSLHECIIHNSTGQYWDLGRYSLLHDLNERAPVSYLQVAFHKQYPFTKDDPPVVTILQAPGDMILNFRSVYYYEGDRVAGCFILGYVEEKMDISFTVEYNGLVHQGYYHNWGPKEQPDIFDEVEFFEDRVEVIRIPGENLLAEPSFQFVHGDTCWDMDQAYSLSDGLGSTWFPNFFVKISFNTEGSFHGKGLTLNDVELPDEQKIGSMFYLDESGSIAGMFVYGYITTGTDVGVTTYLNMVPYNISDSLTFHVEPNFSLMTTQELVTTLNNSTALQALSPLSSWRPDYTLDDFVGMEGPQYLLFQPDCIDVMMDTYEKNTRNYRLPLLLGHPKFSSLMTEEQAQRWETIKG